MGCEEEKPKSISVVFLSMCPGPKYYFLTLNFVLAKEGNMKSSNLLIIIIWIFFLRDAYLQGIDLPKSTLFSNAPKETILVILTFPFLFFLPAAFLQRKSRPFDIPLIRKYVDKKFGQGTFHSFITRLKPITLFMLGCILLGATGIYSTFISTGNLDGYVFGGFFLSGGLGLLCAYLLSIKYPPRLI